LTAAAGRRGNQIVVFGRRGARPFNLDELRRMHLRNGKVYTVTDDPPGPAKGGTARGRD